jgi:hypothetical protein
LLQPWIANPLINMLCSIYLSKWSEQDITICGGSTMNKQKVHWSNVDINRSIASSETRWVWYGWMTWIILNYHIYIYHYIYISLYIYIWSFTSNVENHFYNDILPAGLSCPSPRSYRETLQQQCDQQLGWQSWFLVMGWWLWW